MYHQEQEQPVGPGVVTLSMDHQKEEDTCDISNSCELETVKKVNVLEDLSSLQ